jgi:hypothetical protein
MTCYFGFVGERWRPAPAGPMKPWTLRVAMLDRAAAVHFFVAEPASIAAPICYRVTIRPCRPACGLKVSMRCLNCGWRQVREPQAMPKVAAAMVHYSIQISENASYGSPSRIIRTARGAAGLESAFSIVPTLSFLASSHSDGHQPSAGGRFLWVARRRTNIWCPRDRAL